MSRSHKTYHKTGIISFKADDALLDAMDGIPNRSEFIRNAVLTALDSTCPLCRGTGILTPQQSRHWREFTQSHDIQTCHDCGESHLVCHK
jgi:hypothetical protein